MIQVIFSPVVLFEKNALLNCFLQSCKSKHLCHWTSWRGSDYNHILSKINLESQRNDEKQVWPYLLILL